MKASKIKSASYLGKIPVMDIMIDSDAHLFYANGIAVSNCKAHATSYAMYSAVQMYLQEKYFIEYMCVLLSHIDRADEKKGKLVLDERVEYCIRNGCSILYPSVNKPSDKWEIEGGAIRASIKNIKGFNDKDVEAIKLHAPYSSLNDFADKVKFTPSKFDTLIYSHALDDFGTVESVYNWYHNQYLAEKEGKKSGKQETWSLFGDEDEKVEELPPRLFSQDEICSLSLDVNGFYVRQNLLIKYKELYGRNVSEFENLQDALEMKSGKILTISEFQVEAKKAIKEKLKFKKLAVLVKVEKTERKISRTGTPYQRVSAKDGVDDIIFFNFERLPVKEGGEYIFAISVGDFTGTIKKAVLL